ncbi:MAG: PKD domain-containing protein [Planctomycetota bacterium]|nr:MAG: PKD domain-containing protein [Planctomycetota bacterium]
MLSRMYLEKPVLFLYLITLCIASDSGAQDTPLDLRRLTTLQRADSAFTLGSQDPSYPTPNRTLSNTTGQNDYQTKILAIFARVQQGQTSAGRLDEANQLLRYVINHWPALKYDHLVGQYASAWNHRERSMGTRIYFLYKDYMDADILEDFENRMGWVVGPTQTSSSENIKMTSNALIYLGHEATNQTHLPSFTEIRTWIENTLRSYGNNGFFEWGAPYHFWTLGATLNLAEFAEDQEIRILANMAVDYTLGCMAGFSIDGNFNSAAIRKWYWTYSLPEPHSYTAQILFYDAPLFEYFTWIEWAATNYLPLSIVNDMFHNSYQSETYMTLVDRWHIYSYVMDRVAISTHHTLIDNYYGNPGETHDIAQCIIQSKGGDYNQIQTYAIHPTYDNKYRSTHDRSFGYQNAAIVNGGGYTKKAWSGGTLTNVPIRLYYHSSFSVSFDGGWAFLTDGHTYVAWAPTVGSPIHDPELDDFLKSDYTPGDTGEASVVEVGDPESFGSFTDFRNEILTRNPRPRWVSNKVVYTAWDGAVLEFGTNYAKVDGVNVNPAGYPRADSTLGITDNVFAVNGQVIEFDFNGSQVYGPQDRLDVSRYYGFIPKPPVAVIDADPISGAPPLQVSFDASGSYDLDGTIVSYEWDFDNNSTVDATGITTSHTYLADGTYTCKLTVTDNDAQTGSDYVQIYVITNPTDSAVFIGSTIPDLMRPGEVVSVDVTIQNTGNTTWTHAQGYKLGAVSDDDPFADIRHNLSVSDVIAPGQQKTFTFTMTAPATSGIYLTDWQMFKESVGWFGELYFKQVEVTDAVWIDLGAVDDENGLYRSTDTGDGDTIPASIGGRDCRTNEDPGSDFYMYYNVDDGYAYLGSRPEVFITIEYYDSGSTNLTLQYDSSDTAPFPNDIYKSGGSVALTGTDTWKSHTYYVTDAYFGNRQNGGADFRIFGGVENTFYLDVVKVADSDPNFIRPVAVIDADSTSGYVPLEVSFDGSNSYDVDGTIVSYEWDFDNDGTVDATGVTGTHTYQGDTGFTAKLMVTDNDDLIGTATVNITVLVVPGDFDIDGDVDQEDFGHIQMCMTGTGEGPPSPGCEDTDLDNDDDVDSLDFDIFQVCMNGADIPADPNCATN